MELLSVNIGRPRTNPWKGASETGIDKRPVDGPVRVTAPGPKGTGAVGLAGDRVYDVKHHGGDHQAVCAFAREDLDHWERTLSRPLANGAFGENLTTAGIDVNAALIGERWRIGDGGLVLEVACPRIPCGTFEGWLGEHGWLKTFTHAARPGPYLRVIDPGVLRAGDAIEVIHRPAHDMTVAMSFRALTTEPELLAQLAEIEAFPPEDRARVRARLAP